MTTKPKRKRIYLGLAPRRRVIFSSAVKPTVTTHPQYLSVIGPFRTIEGAEAMRTRGDHHSCATVAGAERFAKRESEVFKAQAWFDLTEERDKLKVRVSELERALLQIAADARRVAKPNGD